MSNRHVTRSKRSMIFRAFISPALWIVSLLFLGGVSLPVSIANAQEDSADDTGIKVIIRTIHAVGERAKDAEGVASPSASMDDCLSDLRSKLELLPFSTFKMIARAEDKISLKRRDSIKLPNNQTLAFRPMYMENKRVGMWLSWRDADGSAILNTRIHFDEDDSVITGTDFHENEGRILAIKAVRLQ